MVKKCIRYIIIFLLSICLIYVGYSIYLIYIPGIPSSLNSIKVKNVIINDPYINIGLISGDSALVFKPYIKEVEDRVMTIKIYKGFRINDSEKSARTVITEDISNIDKIVLSDGIRQEVIWER